MSDMYGVVRSNVFRVKDVDAFKAWFTSECYFGEEIGVFGDDNGLAFGGYEAYPSAYPRYPAGDDDYQEEWDLDEFAKEFSTHLIDGDSLVVVSAGNEKLRYVTAERLCVANGCATFDRWYAGN